MAKIIIGFIGKLEMSVIAQRLFVTNCLLIVTLLTSCNRSNAKEDLNKEMQSVSSWSATAQMVGNAWLKGNLPDKYAQQTLKKTQTELLKNSNNIAKIKSSSNYIHHYQLLLTSEVLKLASQSNQISITIAKHDNSATQLALQQLESEIQNLNQLKIPEESHEKNL
jgi:hypothetical protein